MLFDFKQMQMTKFEFYDDTICCINALEMSIYNNNNKGK